MYRVRADLDDPEVERLARAFGANVVLQGAGDAGSLRTAATTAGTPTITVEMGTAHRFQSTLIQKALDGVENRLGSLDVLPSGRTGGTEVADGDGWRPGDAVAPGRHGRTRGDVLGPLPARPRGRPICTVSDHFKQTEHAVTAPFTGLIVGILENSVALPGHPLCHLARVDDETRDEIEREIASGEFDGYRSNGHRWMGDGVEAE